MVAWSRFVVREKYPSDRGKERPVPPSKDALTEIFKNAKPEDSLKKVLNPKLGISFSSQSVTSKLVGNFVNFENYLQFMDRQL